MTCIRLIFLFVFSVQVLCAQKNNFSFINFSSKDGLSSNTINAIHKDRHGYMWFATDDGINKFDGVHFTVYKNHPDDSTSIGAGVVTCIQEDSRGNLWIGTGRTLSMYQRDKDAFINYNSPAKGAIRSLRIDHSGNIWVGTYWGLYLFDPRTGKTKNFKTNTQRPDEMMNNAIISLFEDSHNRIWVGTITGLYLYLGSGTNFKKFANDANDPNSISDKIIRSIAEDANGNLWFGTNDGGLNMLLPDGRSFKHFRYSAADKTSLSSDRIYSIALENTGKLWLGTEAGLNIFNPVTAATERIENDPRNGYSLRGKSVRSVLLGKDGIYWIGTLSSGVNKYDKNLAVFNLRQSNPFDPYGLSSAAVTSFAEDMHGDIYIGTDAGKLNLYHRNSGLFTHIPLGNGHIQSILSLARVGNEIWIGTYADGLYVLNMFKGSSRHYTRGEGAADLSSNEIFCIREDKKGKVWLGTNGEGLMMYDPETRTFKRFLPPKFPEPVRNGGLPSNGFIRTIAEDAAGNLWIGSNGTGVVVFNNERNLFTLLDLKNSNLPSDYIMDIHVDHANNIWMGTQGAGLCRYNRETKNFTTYSEKEGLVNGFVNKILEDKEGRLWISTNKGVSSFDAAQQKFKNYSHYNGLQQSPFTRASGLKTTDGELFFGGLDGFNYFNPSTLNTNRNIPALVLTDLKVSNQSVLPGKASPISGHISVAKEVRLNYKQNFSIDFAVLNYTNPQEGRYSYKLEGFDKDWNEIGYAKSAVYTNVDPGTYTFRVKATSDDGLWSTPEKSIMITVSPPFWKTIYAYIFYGILAALAWWALRYRSIRKIKNRFALEKERFEFRHMMEQERKEAERIHEFDQVKIKFLTNLSHEFRTPIALITEPVEKLLQEETAVRKQEQLGMISRNARRLLNLVNQLLDFRKLEENELKPDLTQGDLVSFVKEVGDSFKDISNRKHINFVFTSSLKHYYTCFDRDKIERVLFNLLSNAFKFTKTDGSVWLNIEQSGEGSVKIIVGDTGVGISAGVQQKIFERFFQGDENTSIMNQGSGIGLSIVKEFVNLHGGKVSVESTQGMGSIFTVELPCIPITKDMEEPAFSGAAENRRKTAAKEKEVCKLEKPTVLIIEDHDDFRSYLCDSLKPYYKIIEASDGKEGWQKTLSSHPQIVVSDINMPEMDGIALCQKIRADKRTNHIPVILLTALTGDENQVKGLNKGANDYLTKPFRFEILHIKIRNLLKLNESLKNTYSRQLTVASPEIEARSDDEKLLLSVTRYIEANIDNPVLSVEELSKHIYMSRGTLYNKIVGLTGETPVEFIRSIKLNKAAGLLENTGMKISEVGYEVGFATPNYFARAFKAKFNISPSDYIQLKRKKQ
jgi:signal transduction histidine kinase/ligand-binding sensor domain-containing protein/CheY-like chemotaxis protein/AraC-like DNA-binding protein